MIENEDFKLPGILGEVQQYIVKTAPYPIVSHTINACLALGSVVLARRFCTDDYIYPHGYFINIAPTGAGKSHPVQIVEKILIEAGFPQFVHRGRYTSSAAFFDWLYEYPKHLMINEEIGKYLVGLKNKEAHMQHVLYGQYIDVYTSEYVKGSSYAQGKQDDKEWKEKNDRFIKTPGFCLLGCSILSDFFYGTGKLALSDGFLNRTNIVISEGLAERQRNVSHHRLPIPIPILEWIKAAQNHFTHVIPLSPTAREAFERYNALRRQEADKLNKEEENLGDILVRDGEKVNKMALIVQKSIDINSQEVDLDSVLLAIRWVSHCSDQLLDKIRTDMTSTRFEKNQQKLLRVLEREGDKNRAGGGWVKKNVLLRKGNLERDDLNKILKHCEEAELIEFKKINTGARPSECYRLIERYVDRHIDSNRVNDPTIQEALAILKNAGYNSEELVADFGHLLDSYQ